MKVGRNDPCPCESGKKYKKCCLLSAPQPGNYLWRRLRTIDEQLALKLMAYGAKVFGEGCLLEAWDEHNLWQGRAFDPDSPEMQFFGPWFLYHWLPDEDSGVKETAPKDLTIAESYLREQGRNLEPLEKRFIEACLAEVFRFYEVVEVEPGEGYLVRDILRSIEFDVIEHSGSKQSKQGDILFGKVIQIDDVSIFVGTAPILIPPSCKAPILEIRNKLRPEDGIIGADDLRDWEFELREVYFAIYKQLHTPPILCNTDGDLMVFHIMKFDIESAEIAFHALKGLNIMETEEEQLESAEFDKQGKLTKVEITWNKKGNRKIKEWDNTVLGHLKIDGKRLVTEVNSEKRAKRLRGEIEKRLGKKTTHKSTVLKSPESMMRNRKPPSEEEAKEAIDLNNSPEVKAHLHQMMDKHWKRWVSEKIPALGNRAPLQAVKDPDGREMVEALLTEVEQHNDPKRLAGYKPDFNAIRRQLGLDVREGT